MQPEKAFSLITDTEEGIEISLSDKQPSNEFFSIDFIVVGIESLRSEMHFQKCNQFLSIKIQ